jgi:hypothetical protein
MCLVNMTTFTRCLSWAVAAFLLTNLHGIPLEVGEVKWGRDLDAATKLSKESGKPVFVLFQEVPG